MPVQHASTGPRAWPRALTLAAWIGLGCTAPTAATTPDSFRVPEWAEPAVATVEIDLVARTVTVVQPSVGLGHGAPPVTVLAELISIGAIGVDAPPGMRRVAVRVRVGPADGAMALRPSTRIPLPSQQQGVLVIAESAVAVPLPAGVSTTAGNTVVVELASNGPVSPNADFDGDGTPGAGAPFAFFSSSACPAARPAHDCLRYETLRAGDDVPRAVGFDVGHAVRRFRARLLIAADGVPQ